MGEERLKNLIVLIYPYFKTEDNINQKLFNPLGIGLLSAQLKQQGINVVKIDCTFKGINEVMKEITRLKPKIIGFYTMITFTKSIFTLFNAFNSKLPESLFICGGPLASLFPEIFSIDFDIIFRGEMDKSFSDFVRQYFNSGLDKESFIKSHDLSKYSGIYIQKYNVVYDNKAIHLSETEFRDLPLVDREDFDHIKYQTFWEEKEGFKATSILTTAGCPFNCDFCSKPIFGNHFRKRDINEIIREIEIIKTLGYNYLWISDDCLTLNLDFLENFCDKLIEKNLNMKYSCLSRVDTLNLELLKKMKQSGCEKVYLGLESGDNEILKLMKKKLTVEKAKQGVKLLKKAGIKIAGFFIVGYPGETWETIEKTFNFALELDLDEVSFNVPYPLPGSELFKRVSYIDLNKDWIIENETKFVYKSNFDETILQEKIKAFYNIYDQKKKQKSEMRLLQI
ncbi:MAG: B12-binding domain-containing radical SAM protein [Promethearchaeota archaeon]|nr:MAG: B12-binding domain-containing radical SAM protein [Candidatus Lokiarchaeota archaeon]